MPRFSSELQHNKMSVENTGPEGIGRDERGRGREWASPAPSAKGVRG